MGRVWAQWNGGFILHKILTYKTSLKIHFAKKHLPTKSETCLYTLSDSENSRLFKSSSLGGVATMGELCRICSLKSKKKIKKNNCLLVARF